VDRGNHVGVTARTLTATIGGEGFDGLLRLLASRGVGDSGSLPRSGRARMLPYEKRLRHVVNGQRPSGRRRLRARCRPVSGRHFGLNESMPSCSAPCRHAWLTLRHAWLRLQSRAASTCRCLISSVNR